MNTQMQKKALPFSSFLIAGVLILNLNCTTADTSSEIREMRITMTSNQTSITADKMKSTEWDTNKVELSEIKLLIEELELESYSDDYLDFEIDDLVVNLPLSGDTLELASQQIPAGEYDALDIEIDADDVSDPDLNDSTGYYSVFVTGTYNGEPFTFRSKKEFERKFRFDPPVTVSDSTDALTLNLSVNIDKWFRHADPTNPEDQWKIERNIEQSFYAHCRYWDRDHGWWDHDDHYGNEDHDNDEDDRDHD